MRSSLTLKGRGGTTRPAMCPTDPGRERHEEVPAVQTLASYHRCLDRIRSAWPSFLAKRGERLKQQERHGVAAEKVAENILEDLFTTALDWSVGDLNNQVEYADLVLTRLGIKYLVIEVKRPGALAWNRRAVEAALSQARGYADKQGVRCVGVSDCHVDGSVDANRLPKAIQAILTNYRGATVHGIPEKAIPAVLSRLEDAARQVGKMPDQSPETAPAYHQLADALTQLRRQTAGAC